MEEKYQEKMRELENSHEGALAKERLAKGRVEIKVAQLEAQVDELQ